MLQAAQPGAAGCTEVPGSQHSALDAQKPVVSAGEKEHIIAGSSVAVIQSLHHSCSVFQIRDLELELEGWGGGEVATGQACPSLCSGRPGGTTLGLEVRKG